MASRFQDCQNCLCLQLWLANIPHSEYISPEAMVVAHRNSYHRSPFLTEYQDKTVVVKFCERYGEDVHGAPAAAGLQLPPLLFKSGLRCIHGDGLRRGS